MKILMLVSSMHAGGAERVAATLVNAWSERGDTVILTPKGATDAPILLTRTPYSAEVLTTNRKSGDLATALYGYDNATDVIVDGGYIRVIPDIGDEPRFGRHGGESDQGR